MENTAFSTKIPLTDELVAQLRPQRHRYFLIFKEPHLRPPVLDEMMPDIQRLIANIAQRYCDSTSPHLQFDELVGEGNAKLAELITKGILQSAKCPTRTHFFKFFKAAVNNHARSRVQRYRYTEKRTGQKPPPRHQRFAKPEHEPEYHKNVDLSLDDPDLGLQVTGQQRDAASDDRDIDWGFGDVSAEFAFHLSPVEKLVFHEMIMPSAHARCYAELDAMRKSTSGKISVKIKFSHMAEAVGLSEEFFEESVLSIRDKIKTYRMMTDEQRDKEARRNATISQLKEVFGLQIPPDIDDMVVRRMLTMAARDQYDKVANNAQLCEMLTDVGAKVPRSLGGADKKLACYGVLYQKNCRHCNICDLRHSCAVEAANMGLSKMALSQKLLGVRQIRIPAFLPRTDSEVSAQIASADEAEIISHLDETYKKALRNGQTYYFHNVGNDQERRYLFCIERESPLKLRFCNPSAELKKRLVGKQKTWCVREGAALSEVIALIEQHGKETFE